MFGFHSFSNMQEPMDELEAKVHFLSIKATKTLPEEWFYHNDRLTPLCSAVLKNKVDLVKKLLRQGENPNKKMAHQFGQSALHFAAAQDKVQIAALLIQHGADINQINEEDMSPLHIACARANEAMVALLLKKGADIHARCESRTGTPLLVLVASTNKNYSKRYLRILSLLIKQGVNVNDTIEYIDQVKITALHLAVVKGDLESSKILINAKADVNAKSSKSEPVLFYAFHGGSLETIKYILNVDGLNVMAKCDLSNTALHIACARGYLDSVKILVERNVDINAQNKSGQTPLHFAIKKKHFHVVEYLLQRQANVNIVDFLGNLPLNYVHYNMAELSFKGRLHFVRVVKEIICKTNDINVKGILTNIDPIDTTKDVGATPLQLALSANSFEFVKCLIERGADVNPKCNENDMKRPLHIACQKRNVDMVTLLLAHDANVNVIFEGDGHQPLHEAIRSGMVSIVKQLLQYGAEIDRETLLIDRCLPRWLSTLELAEESCRFPFYFYCCDSCNDTRNTNPAEILRLLELNTTFFKNVRSNRYNEVVKNINAGACVNVSSVKFGTCLIYAAWKGYQRLVDLLIVNKANVNAKNTMGYAALHIACKENNIAIVRILLEAGAHYNMPDDKNMKTPLVYATDNNNKELAKLLQFIEETFDKAARKDISLIRELQDLKTSRQIEFKLLKCVKNNKGQKLVDCEELASDVVEILME